jgi:hypothetical protein
MCIVNAIRSQDPPGRFLELDCKSGSWLAVDDERAIEKTCQTLRKNNTSPSYEKPAITYKKKLNERSLSMIVPKQFDKLNTLNKSPMVPPMIPSMRSSITLPISYKSTDNAGSKCLVTSSVVQSNALIDPSVPMENLSSFNDIILANLKQYYSSQEHRASMVSNICQSETTEHLSNGSSGENDSEYDFSQDEEELDDDTFNAIMDLSPGSSNSGISLEDMAINNLLQKPTFSGLPFSPRYESNHRASI